MAAPRSFRVAASVSTAVKQDSNTCPSSLAGKLPGSLKNTLSRDKPKPPLLGESPTELSLSSLSRQGWFDLQSTGSSWGWDRIPGSEGGQTRAFLDGDQEGDEDVSNAPLAPAAGLRFHSQRQRVRKRGTEEQTASPQSPCCPSQSPRHHRERAEGKGERPKGRKRRPHRISGGRLAGGLRVAGGEGALWGCSRRGEAPPPHAPSACAASGIRPGPRRHVGSAEVTRPRRRRPPRQDCPQPRGARAGAGRQDRCSPAGRRASSDFDNGLH